MYIYTTHYEKETEACGWNSENVVPMFLQNPREADAMTKIQTDLDETKIILVITLSCTLFLHLLPVVKPKVIC